MDIGDIMMKGGGVGDVLLEQGDLPDEMFEDMLHSVLRLKDEFNRHTNQVSTGPSTPPVSAIFHGGPPDLEWDPDEEITKPMGVDLVEQERQRAMWKAQGLCPECGDKSKESSVGICRDHGKFLG